MTATLTLVLIACLAFALVVYVVELAAPPRIARLLIVLACVAMLIYLLSFLS